MMLVVLTAGFASCSNDDIPMEEDVTMKTFDANFKINPKTVIEPFTYEAKDGELQVFDEKYQLRVRLLLYNQVGDYIDEEVQKFPSYMVTMQSSKQLQAGSYKAIVITDLELKSSYSEETYVKEYWKLSDYKESNLSNLKIMDGGKVAGKNKILGIAYQNFTIEPNGINEVKIDVKPAGGIMLLYNYYHHYREYVKQIQLGTNKLVKEVIFSVDGSYSTNEFVDQKYDNKRLYVLNNKTECNGESCGHINYDYIFVLPAEYNLKWMLSDTYTDFKDLHEAHQEPMTVNIREGEEWFIGLNLKEGYYLEPQQLEGSRAVNPIWDAEPIFIPENLRENNK